MKGFSSIHNTTNSRLPTSRFPYRLHEILEDASESGQEDVISWTPCGTKFLIRDPEEFAKILLPKYCRHSNYKSFLRQLSMYKFQRIGFGPSKGCYFHPHFMRHRPDLADYVNRDRIERIPGFESPIHSFAAANMTPADDSFENYNFEGEIVTSVDKVPVSNQDLSTSKTWEEDPMSMSHTCASTHLSSSDIIDEIIITFRFSSSSLGSEENNPPLIPSASHMAEDNGRKNSQQMAGQGRTTVTSSACVQRSARSA